MMIKRLMVLLCALSAQQAYAQHFGNSSFLKYNQTEFELYRTFSRSNIEQLESPAKLFGLKHTLSNAYGIPVVIRTSGFDADMGGGEIIGLNERSSSQGIEMSYMNWGLSGYTTSLRFNQNPRFKKRNNRLFIRGRLSIGDRKFDISDGSDKLQVARNSLFGDLSARWNFTKGNGSLFFTMKYIDGNEDNTPNQETGKPGWQMLKQSGTYWNPHIEYKKNFSSNHELKISYTLDNFDQNQGLDWINLKSRVQQVSVDHMLRRKKVRFNNSLSFEDHSTQITGDSMRDVHYQLVSWKTGVLYEFKKRQAKVHYSHILSQHSVQGILFNPTIRFDRKAGRLRFNAGAFQRMRNPSLFSEFQSYYLLNNVVLTPTTELERYRKAFGSVKIPVRANTKLDIQYSVNELDDKWTVNEEINRLVRDQFRYSEFNAQYKHSFFRDQLYYNVSYNYRELISGPAMFVPKHMASGTIQHKLRKGSRFFDYSIQTIANVNFVSSYNMPYVVDGSLAENKGGLYADLFFRIRMGNQNDYDYNRRKLDFISILAGVNNLTNAGISSQKLEAALYNPVIPRTIVLGVQVKL